jgi:hypothetical protein
MAIYAVQGLYYAVHGLYAAGCLAMAYPLYRFGLNPSFLAKDKRILIEGIIKDFVNAQAKKMGLEKEVIIILGKCQCYHSFGNTWFNGKVGIQVANSDKENIKEFKITRELAHINVNEKLTIFGGVLAAALFTTLVLAVNRDIFTGYLGGLGAGLITKVVLSRWVEKKAELTAMQYCSKVVNQAYLDKLLKIKQKGSGRWILCRPSLDERIRYFQAHLHT